VVDSGQSSSHATMSTSVRDGDPYPGNDLPLSQLSTATERKLENSTGVERCFLLRKQRNPENLQSLLHVAWAYLDFGRVYVSAQLDGPNGGLTMRGNRVYWLGSIPGRALSSGLWTTPPPRDSRDLQLRHIYFRYMGGSTNTLPDIFSVSWVTSTLSS